MAKSDIKNIVSASFLNAEEKLYLLNILETESNIPKFEKEFERLLIREIERRKEAHFSICQKFEHEIAERKTKIKKEQERMMTDVVKALSKIQETDIARRSEIWQDYDRKIQQMNRAFLDELDILFSKLTVQHI